MANIQVNRGETKLGNFSEEEIREGLKSGRFAPTDLGWREGMPAWLPLAQFPEFATPGALAPAEVSVPQSGLPWDRRRELGLLPAFIETLKLVLLNPTAAFGAMKPEGGLGEPLIYAVIGSSFGFLFYFIFSMFFSSLGFMRDHNPLAGFIGFGIGGIFMLVFIPFAVVLGLFIGSGIVHLCLMLVGGAKRSYETTFRVLCYSAGSAYPLMIIPICGGFISGIWCLVVECIGLGRAHETTTGKALLAVFLPIVVCCGGWVLLAVMFGSIGALMGHHH
ncbi:MAG: YIP1 family protein [Chthoniobacterales bacterium]